MAMTVVVTGATGGIGEAVTVALARQGHRVVAVGRSARRLDELHARHSSVAPVVADLRESRWVVAATGRRPARRPGALCRSGRCRVVAELTRSTWDDILAVNLTGPAQVTRELLPALRRARGRVIFINAARGVHGVPRWSAYAGSKAALTELADALRREEDAHGVRVTTIHPGGVEGALLRRVREQLNEPYDAENTLRPETLAAVVVHALQFPDGQLTDIAVRATPAGARNPRT